MDTVVMATRLTPCTLRSRRCLKAGYVSANDENLNKIANALWATWEHLVYTLEMHGSLIRAPGLHSRDARIAHSATIVLSHYILYTLTSTRRVDIVESDTFRLLSTS